MKLIFVFGVGIAASLYMLEASPLRAQPQKQPTAVTQCPYSSAIIGLSFDEPLRYVIDSDGRGLLFIHKVQTNFDFKNPFKTEVFAEKPTCRLKLDCVASTEGLKSVSIETTDSKSSAGGERNVWVRIGFSIVFRYDAGDKTCHVVGIEDLY